MSALKQLGLLLVIALAAGGVVWSGALDRVIESPAEERPSSAGEAASQAVPVIVQEVRLQSDAAVIEAVGSGEAVRAVTLYADAVGRVTEVLFRAGQTVEEDQPLLRLEDDDEQLALRLAQVHLEAARQTMSRYEKAAPSGAVSATEVEQARTALSAARIELDQADLALSKRTLLAPFEGVIGIPEVNVGDRISETTPVAPLDDRTPLIVDFEVPEGFAYGVEIDADVTATTWAIPGEEFQGVIDAVSSRIDPETRTLRVRAHFENQDNRLQTGMSFTVRLPLQGRRFPSVPSIAVQWDREGAHVWRIVDEAAERVGVRVLKREEQWVLVDAPLSVGDRIVIEGMQRVRAGRSVTIREATGAPAAEELTDGV